MKKAKRLLALGAAAMMLASALAMPASAANYKKYDMVVHGAEHDTVYRTPQREKTNASGVYVFYDKGTEARLKCDVLNSENESMCRGRIGFIKKGEKGLIAQWVYEEGFHYAKLQLKPDSGLNGGASGEWSPDSVGSYPYIN